MTESTVKHYDLEDRTLRFAKSIIDFTNTLPKTIPNIEMIKQVVRSSGSIGANYIEANEALSKKDFALHIKICRKEAKETQYWLKLLEIKTEGAASIQAQLIGEVSQLVKIFSAIAEKST